MWACASSSWTIDIAEPKLLSAGRVLGGAQVGRRADELGVGRHREDAPDALQVLRRHVLQALDQLARLQVLADLVLGAWGQVLDRCGDHGAPFNV